MNIQRVIATFIKEGTLLLRDWPGLLMLLGMPMILIIVMAIIQDVPFKDYQDVKFNLVWSDDDQKPLGDSLKSHFIHSGQFTLIDQFNDKPINTNQARQLISEGKYPVGVIIKKGTYAEMVNKTNIIVNVIGQNMGNPAIIPVRPAVDSISVVLIFDPVAKNTFRMAVQNALERMLFKVQFDLLFKKISSNNSNSAADKLVDTHEMLANSISQENLGRLKNESLVMNSVQHNVPAWIVFAIFFLVIPLSGNYIKEKNEGSRLRIAMSPGSYFDIINGKVLLYTCFGIFQFLFLLTISIMVLPYFGLPGLDIGHEWWNVILAAVVITFSAISFGMLIGSYFNTYHQAMMFGSITIILMSAIGGIWIPIEVLPHWMQSLAKLSPLHWSLNLVQDVFLRGIVWSRFLVKMSVLMGFGTICLFASTYFHNRK